MPFNKRFNSQIVRPVPIRYKRLLQKTRTAVAKSDSVAKVSTMAKDTVAGGISSIFNSIITVFSDEQTMILVVIAMVLGFTAHKDPTNTMVHKIAGTLANNPITSDLAEWINTNAEKITGMAILMPGAWSAPSHLRYIVMAAAGMYVWVSPAHTIFVWAGVSLALRAWFRTKTRTGRTIIACLILFAFMFPQKIDAQTNQSRRGSEASVSARNLRPRENIRPQVVMSEGNSTSTREQICKALCQAPKCLECCLNTTVDCIKELSRIWNYTTNKTCEYFKQVITIPCPI